MSNFTLHQNDTALLVIDVQDKLFHLVERSCEVMQTMKKVIRGFQILNLPIFVTEQYPEGLGPTIATLKCCLEDNQHYSSKTTFSCARDSKIKEKILSSEAKNWVLVGIEAHVCILQTAKDLLALNKNVIVLNDAISSRSIYDYSTAIAEMRDCGIRISSTETILFELLKDSKDEHFKEISKLIKEGCSPAPCC